MLNGVIGKVKLLSKITRSYKSADLFTLYQTNPTQVISRLLKLGINSYRFSIKWSHIEATKGKYSAEKMALYVEFCKHLRNNGISPMITLHHFSEPKWFHNARSFENEANINDFVKFAEHVYCNLTIDYQGKPLVEYFCTINEPAIDAFSRFVMGTFSPGKKLNFKRAAKFLKGALKAHCFSYQRLKQINAAPKIGFTHQYLRFISKVFLVSPVCRYFTQFVNDVTINWFRTGKFACKIPLLCNISDDFRGVNIGLDFIGVQYYTRL